MIWDSLTPFVIEYRVRGENTAGFYLKSVFSSCGIAFTHRHTSFQIVTMTHFTRGMFISFNKFRGPSHDTYGSQFRDQYIHYLLEGLTSH